MFGWTLDEPLILIISGQEDKFANIDENKANNFDFEECCQNNMIEFKVIILSKI